MEDREKTEELLIGEINDLRHRIAELEEAEVKPHFHKTHNEMIYVLKGLGQMLINGKWIDVKPGTFHFNPMNKVHATKNTDKEELVIFSI
jgi:quercetin dioxygenase-like cupin family protein